MSKDIMGNQQVAPEKLAWLAGIWDGEGTFGIYKYRPYKERYYYCARLTLSNTCVAMIDEIVHLFTLLGIQANYWKAKRGRSDKHKLEVHITVDRQESVRRGCLCMLPYLVVKKERAQILIDFIGIRMNYKRIVGRDLKTGRLTGVIGQGYEPGCITLYERLKFLNQVGANGGTSETLRQEP